jgi:MtN3 and saliva related transmembrane protein
MEGGLATGLGFVAGLLSTSSFVPQLLKAWKESDLSGISPHMYVVNLCSFTLWTTYGTLIGSLPVIVFNALCFMLSAAILILKLRKSDAAGKALA